MPPTLLFNSFSCVSCATTSETVIFIRTENMFFIAPSKTSSQIPKGIPSVFQAYTVSPRLTAFSRPHLTFLTPGLIVRTSTPPPLVSSGRVTFPLPYSLVNSCLPAAYSPLSVGPIQWLISVSSPCHIPGI